MDLHMPELDGLGAIQKIREGEAGYGGPFGLDRGLDRGRPFGAKSAGHRGGSERLYREAGRLGRIGSAACSASRKSGKGRAEMPSRRISSDGKNGGNASIASYSARPRAL